MLLSAIANLISHSLLSARVLGHLQQLQPSAILLTAAAFLFSLVQFIITRRRERFDLSLKFLTEWRGEELSKAKRYVREAEERFKTQMPTTIDEFSNEEDRKYVYQIMVFSDHLGTAMMLGRIDNRLVLTQMFRTTYYFWSMFGPLVEQQRKRDHARREKGNCEGGIPISRYFAGFENAAAASAIFPDPGSSFAEFFERPTTVSELTWALWRYKQWFRYIGSHFVRTR
jgi:hypothetical protein